jgi:hypothetical protein
LYEAFRFSVGLWSVEAGVDVTQAIAEARAFEDLCAVATAVIGHQALRGDAKLGEEGQGGLQEAQGADVTFAREHRREGQAGVVINDDVKV